MSMVLYLVPLWMGFELGQLVMAERYLGVAQIKKGGDPRQQELPRLLAKVWSLGLMAELFWLFCALAEPMVRAAALCMLAVWALGFGLRRSLSLKWTLVILTFEGAVRLGFLFYLLLRLWRNL